MGEIHLGNTKETLVAILIANEVDIRAKIIA